jgi:phosphatidate cytidylyltransferase
VNAGSTASGNLASRLVVATGVIAVFAGLAWADMTGLGGAGPACWLMPIAAVAAAWAASEAATLAAAGGCAIRRRLVLGAAVGITVAPLVGLAPSGMLAEGSACVTPAVVDPACGGGLGDGRLVPLAWAAAAAAVAVAIIVAAELPGYVGGEHRLARAVGGGFTAVAIGLPLACMVALRLFGEWRTAGSPLHRLVPLLSLIAVVKGGDIAAYVVGSLVGRHRMAPRLSPGKTWEGAVGSLVASAAAAWGVIEWLGGTAAVSAGCNPSGPPGFDAAVPAGGWLVYGLVVGAAGMVGDLAESFVKRELAAKDSGRMLGGLGGALDLIDSLLVAAPVAWLLWAL